MEDIKKPVIPKGLLIKSVRQTPTITICTDASYDPQLGIGAWACYIRSGDKIIKLGKVIKEDVTNSTEAERVGVANALWLASRAFDISECRIVLYCDNLAALNPVRPSTKTGQKRQAAKKQLEFYQKNIEPFLQKALTYDARHVKGHLERTARHRMKARHHLNDWCDKEARELLQKERSRYESDRKSLLR